MAGAQLLALALDPRVEPPDDAVSARILDAALALAAASGLRNLTIDDVARRAGVGRMTVYRRFGDRAGLERALVVREVRRCIDELDAAVRPDAPLDEQVAEGFVTAVRLARTHPLLSRLARIEPGAVVEGLNADDAAIVGIARAFLASRLRRAHEAGVVGTLDVDVTAELLTRLAFSFVLIEHTVLPVGDEERLREVARALVTPLLRG